jgi:hypothetical protein
LLEETANHTLPVDRFEYWTIKFTYIWTVLKFEHRTSFIPCLQPCHPLLPLTIEGIKTTFQEIFDPSLRCKFPDCKHIDEIGCAVIKALSNNRKVDCIIKLNISYFYIICLLMAIETDNSYILVSG